MNISTPCYLSSLGIINALGTGKIQVLNNLISGSQEGMVECDNWMLNQSTIVGEVNTALPVVPKHLSQYQCRNNQLLLAAYEQIEQDVQHAIEKYGSHRVAVVVGSSTSGILEGEQALHYYQHHGEMPKKYHYKQQEIGTPAEFLAMYLNLQNVAYTVSTACSSSAKAFACAKNLLSMDFCDAVITGGADSLCQLTVNGFAALQSVSDEICNPFSANRKGINIGEGAALFLLEKQEAAIELCSVGESADAHHISAPHPDGVGAEKAILSALQRANIESNNIHYVNLHGTATVKNDDMESKAMHRVFGSQIPCSSTKPQTGHTLGAAGANEIGFCWLLLSKYNSQAQLPKQLWDACVDTKLENIGLIQSTQCLPTSINRYLMSNSFAFGGSNASVILRG